MWEDNASPFSCPKIFLQSRSPLLDTAMGEAGMTEKTKKILLGRRRYLKSKLYLLSTPVFTRNALTNGMPTFSRSLTVVERLIGGKTLANVMYAFYFYFFCKVANCFAKIDKSL